MQLGGKRRQTDRQTDSKKNLLSLSLLHSHSIVIVVVGWKKKEEEKEAPLLLVGRHRLFLISTWPILQPSLTPPPTKHTSYSYSSFTVSKMEKMEKCAQKFLDPPPASHSSCVVNSCRCRLAFSLMLSVCVYDCLSHSSARPQLRK